MKKEILEAIELQKMIEDYLKTSDESYVDLMSKFVKNLKNEYYADNIKELLKAKRKEIQEIQESLKTK